MIKKFLTILSVITVGYLAVSCEDDDICVEGSTPNLTVVFRNNLNAANQADTLTIYASANPDFNQQILIYEKVFSDSLKLPLGGLNDQETYFSIQRRSNSTADILTVSYNTQSEYVSKACGFRIVYENLNYQSTQHYIEYLIPSENQDLKDETATNLRIALSN
ncbi:MAG: DUF6452 family protein [Weeksellaceae bacterium]